jgi:homoserine kinase
VIVTVPATSANLGPGFDVLGLAVELPFIFSTGDLQDDLLLARGSNPVTVAYREAGGQAPEDSLFWRSPIPPGMGLGFSGAARVAGAFAASLERGLSEAEARQRSFEVATKLEGHPDNAAPSAFGGFCVSASRHTVRVPLSDSLRSAKLIAWTPGKTTSTKSSRSKLPEVVERADAVFNLGHCSLLVAALAAGRLDLLREATQDRLHQTQRLESREDSQRALDVLLANPATLCAWLSGSGPTVAALVAAEAVHVADDLADLSGQTRVLSIAEGGAAIGCPAYRHEAVVGRRCEGT